MTKCRGCGITLQNTDEFKDGYVKDLKHKICIRCFKLKNYNELISIGLNIDNKEIVKKINNKKCLVLYLVDFLNIDNEIMDIFKRINNPKVIILNKVDIIPKNIKINKLIDGIKRVYGDFEIVPISTVNHYNLGTIKNMIDNKPVVIAGFSNSGKSSLINALMDSSLTVSYHKNTTQDFIKVGNIYDAPGFMSNVISETRGKRTIRPHTYNLKKEYIMSIKGIEIGFNTDNFITTYLEENISVITKRKKDNKNFNIIVPQNSDIVIKGLGIIRVSKESYMKINTSNYDIRPSIIGGNHE